MSKKLICAILSIAMIVSMFATAFVTSVGAAAETTTTYVADRDALAKAIRDFYVQGPVISAEAEQFLKDVGLITYNGDLALKWNQVQARNDFWKTYTNNGDASYRSDNYSYFLTDAKAFVEGDMAALNVAGKVVWDKTSSTNWVALAESNISNIVKYIASVWYFGQDPDSAIFDKSFNQGRNAAVKDATALLNSLIGKLKGQVKDDASKPASYNLYFNSINYKYFANNSFAYNASFGVNPYYRLFVIDGISGNYNMGATEWFTTLPNWNPYFNDSYYIQSLQTPVKWYTFDEVRAISADAKTQLFELEKAMRDVVLDRGAGVLFYDFITSKYVPFNDLFTKLSTTIIGTKVTTTTSIADSIKAFEKLFIAVEVYDKYVKDLYNNIYTVVDANLMTKALYAKRIIDTVDNNNKYMLPYLDLNTLADEIIAGMAAATPRAEQVLTDKEVTDGTALVKRAQSYLTAWTAWSTGNDDQKKMWGTLNTAMNNLKDMLPAKAGEAVVFVKAAEAIVDLKDVKDFNGTSVKSDKLTITFKPNYFAYVKYAAMLDAAIKTFAGQTTASTLPAVVLGANNEAALADMINKYGYLFGVVGGVIGKNDTVGYYINADNLTASNIYSYYLFENSFIKEGVVTNTAINLTGIDNIYDFLAAVERLLGTVVNPGNNAAKTCIYEMVVGYVYKGWIQDRNYDVAIDSVYVAYDKFVDAIEYFAGKVINATNPTIKHTDAANNINEVAAIFNATDYTGSYKDFVAAASLDWAKDGYSYKSGFEAVAENLEATLKYLTKDLTVDINTIAYKLDKIAAFFGLLEDNEDVKDFSYKSNLKKIEEMLDELWDVRWQVQNSMINSFYTGLTALTEDQFIAFINAQQWTSLQNAVTLYNTAIKATQAYYNQLVRTLCDTDSNTTIRNFTETRLNEFLTTYDNEYVMKLTGNTANSLSNEIGNLQDPDSSPFLIAFPTITPVTTLAQAKALLETLLDIAQEIADADFDAGTFTNASDWRLGGSTILNMPLTGNGPSGSWNGFNVQNITLRTLYNTALNSAYDTRAAFAIGVSGNVLENTLEDLLDEDYVNTLTQKTWEAYKKLRNVRQVYDEFWANLEGNIFANDLATFEAAKSFYDYTAKAVKEMKAALESLYNDPSNASVPPIMTEDEYDSIVEELDDLLFWAEKTTPTYDGTTHSWVVETHDQRRLRIQLDSQTGNITHVSGWWSEVDKADYQTAANYPNDFFKNFVAAANDLQRLIDTQYKVGDVAYDRATFTSLYAKWDSFLAMTKNNLLTDLGDKRLDEFLAAVDDAVASFYGNYNWFNDYDRLYQKLRESDEQVGDFLPISAAEPYLYYGFKLAYVADWNVTRNIYAFDNGKLEKNLFNKINAHLGEKDVAGYARDWAANYDIARKLGKAVLDCIDLTNKKVNSDMPLWYALGVLSKLDTILADGKNNTLEALAAYKAKLNALIAEAEGKNVYEYMIDANSDAAKIWDIFQKAYSKGLEVSYDARAPKSEIDAAVLALETAIADLEKIEKAKDGATAATLNEKIAEAEALLARADVTTKASKTSLVEAIAAAKKVMQFNINVLTSKEIAAEVAKLDTAIKALKADMYLGPNLRKDVKVLEMKVVKDLYTKVSYDAFKSDCEEAYTFSDTVAKESEYQAMYNKVKGKFDKLKLAPVEEPVVEPVMSAVMKQAIETYNTTVKEFNALDTAKYTAESVAAYKAALDALKAGIDANASDETIVELIVAVKLAKGALIEANPKTCDD